MNEVPREIKSTSSSRNVAPVLIVATLLYCSIDVGEHRCGVRAANEFGVVNSHTYITEGNISRRIHSRGLRRFIGGALKLNVGRPFSTIISNRV